MMKKFYQSLFSAVCLLSHELMVVKNKEAQNQGNLHSLIFGHTVNVNTEIDVCCLARLRASIFFSTFNTPSPDLQVCCLDLLYFERIHNWVYS